MSVQYECQYSFVPHSKFVWCGTGIGFLSFNSSGQSFHAHPLCAQNVSHAFSSLSYVYSVLGVAVPITHVIAAIARIVLIVRVL